MKGMDATMNAKYFVAENREAAAGMAISHFICDEENIIIEQISDGNETDYCQFLALVGKPGEVANMDANFSLYYENDGVYLELYKERGAGFKFESSDLMKFVSRKKIVGLDESLIEELLKTGIGRTKIARAQEECFYGESLDVVISDDNMQASVVLVAPESGGQPLSYEAAQRVLYDVGVVHGVDSQALKLLLDSKRYGEARIVAVGTPAKDGEDGKLVFNFSTDERTGSPMEIGSGRVDYRSLDLYVSVEEGQLLVTREAATEGHPGTTVKGVTINQRPGKEVMFPRGKNVDINEDKTEMYAQCSGMVEFVNNSVNVSNVYKVKGDCDLSVGNIDFDGCVHISGSVRSGSHIKATGGVIVDGSVEAATIIAGGNVEIKGGMQGADKGLIEAGGAVSILYVERGIIHADGPVTVDVSMHSIIESGDTLTAQGRRGAIIGGHVGSCGNIIANYVGTISNTRTEVAVGVTPRKRARLLFLEKETTRISTELMNLDKLDRYLLKSKGVMAPEKWELLYRSSVENRQVHADDLENLIVEKNALVYDMEHATGGKVHVFDTVFSGSRVMIGSDAYLVDDEINYVSFKFDDNESNVVYGPCELSKSS